MPRTSPGGSLERAIDLLTSLSGHSAPLSLSRLARETGLPKSTTHRLLGVLCARDLVKRAGTGYVLGDLLTTLTRERIPGSRPLVLPYLMDLYETTRQTVNVAVASGPEAIYVERIYGHDRVACPSDEHDRAPLHCTAAGKVLLAYDDDARKALLEHGRLARMTQRTITGLLGLDRELALVRRHGLAYSQEEFAPGLTSVAAPVIGPGGSVTMAVEIAGRTSAMRLGRVGIAVRGAAQAISTALSVAA
ncbi:IclR family transcriptional regulator [Nonomuraea sp. NPDC050310]|uniref:IclR family transcriptional regulator n=1 Tax=unclassified Nonomuraea TaxID=2593643 RepID=UPI003411CCEC